ncbi:MAG: hypothetical protein GTO18_17540 [Anaerolineales bacterium]|nr:hypothetical protein [Anaerolineales bacterium]
MIRPFDWRDIGLLNRSRENGLCLDSQMAHTRGTSMLQTIIVDLFAPGRNGCTLVARPSEKDEIAAVGQIMHRAGETRARLTFIGPEEVLYRPYGAELLDALSSAAGERGANHLVADVDENSLAFESMRSAGYAIYARQRIWRLEIPPEGTDRLEKSAWRPETDDDVEAVNHLYLDNVPVLVQQVETPPNQDKGDLVHWHEGELLGYLDIERGSIGVWVHPYFHPAVENLDLLLSDFLSSYTDNQERPLYFAVRSYQGLVGQTLERLGFQLFRDQAVMVKRLAVPVHRPAQAPIPTVEGTRAKPTTPFAHASHYPPGINSSQAPSNGKQIKTLNGESNTSRNG